MGKSILLSKSNYGPVFYIFIRTFGTSSEMVVTNWLNGETAKAVPITIRRSQSFVLAKFSQILKNFLGNYS